MVVTVGNINERVSAPVTFFSSPEALWRSKDKAIRLGVGLK